MGTECFEISWSGKAQKNISKKELTFSLEKVAQIVLEHNAHEKNDIKLWLDSSWVYFPSLNHLQWLGKWIWITATWSLAWKVLLIQLRYSELTDKWHSRVKFPINFISLTQTTIGQMKKLYWIINVVKFSFLEQNEKIEFRSRRKSSPIFWRFKGPTGDVLLWPIYSISIHVFLFSYQTTQQIIFNRLIYLLTKVQNVSLKKSMRTGALMKF